MADWWNVDVPGFVPEWSRDGDGMVVIEHVTPDNAHLACRFDDETRERNAINGWCIFEQFTFYGEYPTREAAMQAADTLAVAMGYDA